MNLRALAVLWIASSGCDGGDPAVVVDAAPEIDASVCTALGTCDWLDSYQRMIVGKLAGAEDIVPGTRLAHRASVPERDAARTFLLGELTALGLAPMRHDYATGANVIARLDATTGVQTGVVIVGGHFDGVPAGPGAADNATGVAIVLAAARYLRELPVRQHPIVFALFDEEELGLIGSKAYAASLVAAGTDIAAVHIFDMLAFDGDGDHAVELWSPVPALTAQYQAAGAVANMPIQPVTFGSSDHQSFLNVGLPATGVGEEFVANDHTPHYHKASDTYANVSFDHLARVTHLALRVLETAAATP